MAGSGADFQQVHDAKTQARVASRRLSSTCSRQATHTFLHIYFETLIQHHLQRTISQKSKSELANTPSNVSTCRFIREQGALHQGKQPAPSPRQRQCSYAIAENQACDETTPATMPLRYRSIGPSHGIYFFTITYIYLTWFASEEQYRGSLFREELMLRQALFFLWLV